MVEFNWLVRRHENRAGYMFEGLLQPTHLIVILVIVMIMFGGKKLPELGKGLGQAIRGFKSAMNEDESSPTDPPKKALPDSDARR
jgi:sec-independent protein translocase protein TatA